MPSAVKSLKVTYKPVNEDNTFTSGDWVSGEVSLELAEECSIDALWVKLKGKAEVLWSKSYGQTTVYHSKDKYFHRQAKVVVSNQNKYKYFSLKHFFIQKKDTKGEEYGLQL